VSCRGHWPNRKPAPRENIALDTFVEDLAAFIRVLEAERVHIVGHSSPGGFGSLILARRYPELLRSLVLLEPPALTLLGVNIPPAPSQLLRLLIRSPRVGSRLIRFGAKGIGPAMKAFDRGDDEEGLRIFTAANTSESTLAGLPEDKFRRYVDNVGSLKAQIKAGFPEFRRGRCQEHSGTGPAGRGDGDTGSPARGDRQARGAAAGREAARHRGRHPQHVRQPPD
jgi:pimeloyl-ACP methyl ester carboxylesterase